MTSEECELPWNALLVSAEAGDRAGAWLAAPAVLNRLIRDSYCAIALLALVTRPAWPNDQGHVHGLHAVLLAGFV